MTTEPTYYDRVTFAGHTFELWLEVHKVKRTTIRRWFARYEGQTENEFRDTVSDSPSGAIGSAILLLDENDAVANRIWS